MRNDMLTLNDKVDGLSFDLSLAGTLSDAVRFAVIDDYGVAGEAEEDVAKLVESWTPDFVITLGDNNYPNGSQDTIVANIDNYYIDSGKG